MSIRIILIMYSLRVLQFRYLDLSLHFAIFFFTVRESKFFIFLWRSHCFPHVSPPPPNPSLMDHQHLQKCRLSLPPNWSIPGTVPHHLITLVLWQVLIKSKVKFSLLFETEHVGPKLVSNLLVAKGVLLLLPPKCWDHRSMPSYHALSILH